LLGLAHVWADTYLRQELRFFPFAALLAILGFAHSRGIPGLFRRGVRSGSFGAEETHFGGQLENRLRSPKKVSLADLWWYGTQSLLSLKIGFFAWRTRARNGA